MFPYPISFLGSAGSAFSSTKSLDFDGVDDYVDTGINTASTNFSFSCWIKHSGTYTADYRHIAFCSLTTSNIQYGGFSCYHTTGTDLLLGIWNNKGTTQLGTGWNHIMGVWDDTTKTCELYLNGALELTYTVAAYGDISRTLEIGDLSTGYSATNYDAWNGNIDEFAYWTSKLTLPDAISIYNSGTPADLTSLSPTAWYRMGENSTFSSQILMPENTNKDKVSNYSMAFDGIDGEVNCGNDSSLHNSNFTISAWVYQPSISGSVEIISNGLGAFGAKDYGFNINRYYGNYRFYIGDGTTSYSSSVAGAVVDTWQHLFMSYDGTDIKTYLNGVLDDTVAVPSISYGTSAQNSFIIGRSVSASLPFAGNIDEVSLFDSAKAIEDLWNGSGKPTDLTSESDLVSWWRMGEEAVFNSTNWLLPNKAQDVFSRYSLDFDGVDDDVSFAPVNSGPLYDIGTGDFTVSIWANATTKADYGSLIGNWNTNGLLMWRKATTNIFECYIGGDGFITSYTIPFDDTWHHYFIKRSGTDVTVYVDGVSVATGTSSATLASNSISYIGNQPHNNRRWCGKIDEVSIFNSAKTIGDLWDGTGKPTDLTGESGIVSWWRMGEDATFSTIWTIPDKTGSNDGAGSVNMPNDALSGDAPGVTGNGVSDNMTIEDRTGDAPDSSNNALSYNMDAADIVEDTP